MGARRASGISLQKTRPFRGARGAARDSLAPIVKPHSSTPAKNAGARLRRLEKRLLGQLAQTSEAFKLLEPNDRVMVAVSGGKDSMSLLSLLGQIRARAPFPLELIAVNLDQGHPGFPAEVLPNYFEAQGFDYKIIREDTYSIVKSKIPEGRTYCSLCSRLRRGILYNVAQELGCTKIALGHHREDTIETLLLNLLYSGQIKAMPPRLQSDDGRNVVIRPLLECAEADIAEYAALMQFPIVPCDLCGSQDNLKRQRIKRLIDELAAENPNVRGNLLAALGNVRVTHLLDRALSGDTAPAGRDAWLDASDDGQASELGLGERSAFDAPAGSPDQPLIPLSALRR
ncbi:MAG: tRNA 2-thiocytidine(32) synthetase TtcA [Polyangiaceae bacterium]|nr:tRNA 2-thiocytidine(32) synthetase TtcA [Myxococcales bacterium]MCB9585136.1 tRNA 2-thiocytidine(32) synthetase TtcA [Polyangiaceae bacterium]